MFVLLVLRCAERRWFVRLTLYNLRSQDIRMIYVKICLLTV